MVRSTTPCINSSKGFCKISYLKNMSESISANLNKHVSLLLKKYEICLRFIYKFLRIKEVFWAYLIGEISKAKFFSLFILKVKPNSFWSSFNPVNYYRSHFDLPSFQVPFFSFFPSGDWIRGSGSFSKSKLKFVFFSSSFFSSFY